jgi:hypothetical protein
MEGGAKKGDKKGKGGSGKGGDKGVTALEGGACGCCTKPGPCGCCGSSTSDASIHSKTLDAHSRMLDLPAVHACMHHAAPHAHCTDRSTSNARPWQTRDSTLTATP